MAGVYDLKAGWRVTEALAAAGGLVGDPIECKASLLRGTGEKIALDLPAVIHGDGSANLALSPGDVLSIEATELLPVFVMGQVKNPGLIGLHPGLGAVEALAQAGGLTAPEDEVRAVVVRGGKEVAQLDLQTAVTKGDPAADYSMQRGDVLKVDSLRSELVTVTGKVVKPGSYPMKSEEGVVELLALAGGVTDDAALSRVTITHVGGGTETVDLSPAIRDGKSENNVKLANGDLVVVPEIT